MKKAIFFSLLCLINLLCVQCNFVKSTSNFLSSGGPPVTKTVDAANYNTNAKLRGNLNQVAAKVDESIVTKNELNFILSSERKRLKPQFPRDPKGFNKAFAQAKEKIFQELIDRELILNEFKNLGASIPPREIDREIKNRINNLYNGKRSLYLADLRKSGLTQAKHRSLIERQMIVGAMKSQRLTNSAPPTTKELQKEYSKFSDKLRDVTKDKVQYQKIWIVKETEELGVTPESQFQLAKDLAKQLRRGGNFSALAKEYSYDVYAEKGGKWPLTKRIDLPIAFTDMLFKTPIGKIVGPLEGPNGFHIFKVTRRVKGPSPPLSKVRKQLEQRVNAEKSAARYNRWIDRLRNKADIVRYM